MSEATSKLAERISKYMACLDPAVSGACGHNRTFHAACVLVHGWGLSVKQAWPFALEYNERCEPPWSDRDLRRKLEQAMARPDDRPRGYLIGTGDSGSLPAAEWMRRPPKPKATFQPDKLDLVASVIGGVTAEYLESRSKFTCWNRTPAGVLHKLYRPGEKIVVFNVYVSQGCEVWEHPGPAGDLSTLDYLQTGQQSGVWFMAQPTDGLYHPNPREGHDSRRSEESVTSWRYFLIESDHAPKGTWLRAVVQMPLRIAAIYDSGGDSVHVLVRVDAQSKAEWDATVRDIQPDLVTLGACSGSLSAVRLTRLPNCMREQKGQLQRLLYLDDAPDGEPICNKPVREQPEAVWLRWADSIIYWSDDESVNPDAKEHTSACIAGLKEFSSLPHVAERFAHLEKIYGS
jgi:hypothetical protein